MPAIPEPAELSASALISRIARVYMVPRWKAWVGALVAAILVAGLSAKLIAILQPAVNDLMVAHKPGALLAIPFTIAVLALARGLAQVFQATLINQMGNAVVGDVQVSCLVNWCGQTWLDCGPNIRGLMCPRCFMTPA